MMLKFGNLYIFQKFGNLYVFHFVIPNVVKRLCAFLLELRRSKADDAKSPNIVEPGGKNGALSSRWLNDRGNKESYDSVAQYISLEPR